MERDRLGLSTIRQTKPLIDTGSGALAAAGALRSMLQSNRPKLRIATLLRANSDIEAEGYCNLVQNMNE
jgi:hypothetical protein